MTEKSSGAFDVNRRGFLALLAATGAMSVLPDSVKAAITELEPISKIEPTLGMWIRSKGIVHYVGAVDSIAVERQEPHIDFMASDGTYFIGRNYDRATAEIYLAHTEETFNTFIRMFDDFAYDSFDMALRISFINMRTQKSEIFEITMENVYFYSYDNELSMPPSYTEIEWLPKEQEIIGRSKLRLVLPEPSKATYKIV